MKGVTIKQKVQEFLQAKQTDFIRGSISVLFQRYVENEFILKHAVVTFTGIVPIPIDVLAMVSLCHPDPVSQMSLMTQMTRLMMIFRLVPPRYVTLLYYTYNIIYELF